MASKIQLSAVLITFIAILSGPAAAGMNELSSQFLAIPVEGDPDRVWYDKGRILYSQKAYNEAFDAFAKIDKNTLPEISDESSYLSANCLMEAGNYADAALFANAVSDKSPFYPFALYTRALINLKKGNARAASDYLEELTKYDGASRPSKVKQSGEKKVPLNEIVKLAHRANLTLGFIHLESNNHNEALRYFSAIPKESAFYAEAIFGLGWTYARMERWVRSIVVWEELFSSYPDSPYTIETVPNIGYAYTRVNAYGKAIEQNGNALKYYRDKSAKIANLKNGLRPGDIDKIAGAVNIYGDKQMSDNLNHYRGLLRMEDYLAELNQDMSPGAVSLINSSKKMREDLLNDLYAKVQNHLEQLQRKLLETSIDTSIGMARNLQLEGGGQISNDMTFIDHD